MYTSLKKIWFCLFTDTNCSRMVFFIICLQQTLKMLYLFNIYAIYTVFLIFFLIFLLLNLSCFEVLRFFSEIFIIFISTGENGSIAISQMLKFISGLEQVPPLGLPDKITIKFKYFYNANCQCRPTASTCDPSITFPLHYDTYDAFCHSMSSALVEGCGFGFV